MQEENKLSDVSIRFLKALEDIGISGYKLKQDGIIGSESTLTKIKQGIQRPSYETVDMFCEKYGVDKGWIYTGKQTIENDSNSENDQDQNYNYRLVPLIHTDSVGGMHSDNNITDMPEYVEQYIPFIDAYEGDRAIFQSGDSMTPTIPPGSIMQIRKVENWQEYFGYGNIFVLLLKDGRRITKEVNRYDANPKKYVWCMSHNPDVADEELPKSMIVEVWKVIRILTNRGW